jgi:hypothetical protein
LPSLKLERPLLFRGSSTAVLLLLPLATLRAQTPPDSTAVVRAVEIHRNDIFDPSETTSWVTRLANGLHITTREGVVRREVLIQPGEPYDPSSAAETARNLRALGVFRQVQVDTTRTDSGLVLVVTTRDGWSTRPDLRFRSTGGQSEYTVAFIEDNLLGTATQASVRYRKTVDRTSTDFSFLQPRFLSRTIRLGLVYEDRSDGHRFATLLGKPFYSLNSRSSLLIQYDKREERILRFFEGERAASDTLERSYSLARLESAVALRRSNRGYLRVGGVAQVRKDGYRPESPPSGQTFLPPPVTTAVGPFMEWRHASYVLTRSFQGFGREEDVDVSKVLKLGVLAAPAAFGYTHDGVAPFLAMRAGTSFGAGFLFTDLNADGLYSSGGLDSGAVTIGGTVVLQPGGRHTVVLHADGGWLKNPIPSDVFDLGLGSGPRAFRSHSFTGDRTFYSTAEYRLTLANEVWHVMGIGLAGFVDYGGAWFDRSKRRTGWDAGIGLRLGASRAASVEAIRIDLAHRFANDVERAGWVLVVGKGLTFSTTPGGNRGL